MSQEPVMRGPRKQNPTRASGLETLGAWMRIWTPPKDVVVPPVPKRKLLLGAVATAAALAAAAAVIVPKIDQGKQVGAQRAREQRAVLVARETARLRKDQALHRGRSARALRLKDPVAAKRAAVADLEAAITADSRQRARKGLLDGPVTGTSCDPAPSTITRKSASYKCFVTTGEVNRSVRGAPFVTGYPFVATIQYRDFSYAWCKTNPGAGERGGPPLAKVKLSPACAGRLRSVL
jgi:hypothetical protein